MAIKSRVLLIGSTPTLIYDPQCSVLDDTKWVEVIVLAGNTPVYLGGPNVTDSDGRPVAPSATVNASWSATLGPKDVLYGVTSIGDEQDILVLESRYGV
jgi:hypothetical protein